MFRAEIEAYLTNEREHMAGDVPLRESGSGVGVQVLPLSLEGFEFCADLQCGIVFDNHLLRQVGF